MASRPRLEALEGGQSATADPLALVDMPPFVKQWIRQLLDPDTMALFRLAGDRQVDVRLSASRGKACRRAAVSFDSGPRQDFAGS